MNKLGKMTKGKTPKQLTIKIRSLKKQIARLEKQKKRASAKPKKKASRKREGD